MSFNYPIINIVKKAAPESKKSFFENHNEELLPDKKSRFNISTVKFIPSKTLLRKKTLFLCAVVIVVLLIILASPVRSQILSIISGQRTQDNEIEALLKEVNEKILLPSDEKPTVATISDITKLENQPFFRGAKNGDKLIIFAGIRKAILYRPEIKKIIEVSTISDGEYNQAAEKISNQDPVVTPTPLEPKIIKVVILNGTNEAGLARKAADLLEGETVEIVATGNAKEDYQSTSISFINTSNLSESEYDSIFKSFTKVKPTTISFPSAETKPENADVVLILGVDFAGQY